MFAKFACASLVVCIVTDLEQASRESRITGACNDDAHEQNGLFEGLLPDHPQEFEPVQTCSSHLPICAHLAKIDAPSPSSKDAALSFEEASATGACRCWHGAQYGCDCR
eukprot:6172888-Pleurochrysis_carterae.AAC.2